jgi:DNA modification methylase
MKKEEMRDLLRQVIEATQTTVLREDKPTKNDIHPTMKPVRLIARPMENSTVQGDIVLDPFGGGGSTLIAAEKHGRTCRMMELSPLYCDRIIARWEHFTGQQAERL